MPQEVAAIPLPAALTGDILYVAADGSAISDLARVWLPGLQQLPYTVGPGNKPDFYAFRWPEQAVSKFLSAQTSVTYAGADAFKVLSYEAVAQPHHLVLNVLWQQLDPSGPYDLYLHLLDSSNKQVGQSDHLVWPVVRLEGSDLMLDGLATRDLLLTQSVIDVPPGQYTAVLGVAHRSWEDRSQVIGGAIGQELRLTVSV